MRKLSVSLLLAPVMALGLTLGSNPTQARESREVYHGFVKDIFYLGRGGTPATFEQVASNPLAVVRSAAAYDALRVHIGTYLGTALNDADFRTLLRSDAVRLVPCTGQINTAGITDAGRIGWKTRACYRNEMLIQVRLSDGQWRTTASQGCFNPVESTKPPPLPPPPAASPPPPPPPAASLPPPPSALVNYQLKRVGELVTPGVSLTTGGSVFEVFSCPANCVCKDGIIISTSRVTTGGFSTTSGMFQDE